MHLDALKQSSFTFSIFDLPLKDSHHTNDVEGWLKKHSDEYASVKYLGPHSFLKEHEARSKSL